MPPTWNFLCFDRFAGRADEDELFQTRSKFWNGPGGAAWCRRKRGILEPARCPVLAGSIRWRGLRVGNTA